MLADRTSFPLSTRPICSRAVAQPGAEAHLSATTTAQSWKKANDGCREPPPYGALPSEIIGKVLVRVQRSATHPVVTLYFADHSIYQVRVDGYDPADPGVAKEIETDPGFEGMIFNAENGRSNLECTIKNAVFTTLKDRAFDQRNGARPETAWAKLHVAFAFCFEE